MSREDDRDDVSSSRRADRWGEVEDRAERGPARAPLSDRSGVVTTAGVFTLILGCLVLLAGLCGGAMMLIAGLEIGRGGMMGREQGVFVIALLVCLVILFWGVGAVSAGIGLLNRRNWARVLTLILGGFGAIAGLFFLFLAGAMFFVPRFGPGANMLIVGYLIYLFLGLLFVGYGLWIYLVLLSSRYSVEFR
jgi:hypothetical protein